MDDRIVSTAVLTLSRQQEEFLARYRTHEAQKAYFDSYGLGVTPFFRGGGGSHGIIPPAPEPELPYDYEVEFLEMNDVDNPSYFDLGVVLSENIYDVSAEFALLGYSANNVVGIAWFGCSNLFSASVGLYNIKVTRTITNNSSADFCVGGSGFDRSVHHVVSFDTKYNILLKKDGSIYLNDEYIGTCNIGYNTPGANTFKIFYDEVVNCYTFGRVYGIKIFENENLIHDFIPVSKGGVGYIYDISSDTLFSLHGGGSLVLGPRKE